MRTATAEQLEPIRAVIQAIKSETGDWGVSNMLMVALTNLVPGVGCEMIRWVRELLRRERMNADCRDDLHGVVFSLSALLHDLIKED